MAPAAPTGEPRKLPGPRVDARGSEVKAVVDQRPNPLKPGSACQRQGKLPDGKQTPRVAPESARGEAGDKLGRARADHLEVGSFLPGRPGGEHTDVPGGARDQVMRGEVWRAREIGRNALPDGDLDVGPAGLVLAEVPEGVGGNLRRDQAQTVTTSSQARGARAMSSSRTWL